MATRNGKRNHSLRTGLSLACAGLFLLLAGCGGGGGGDVEGGVFPLPTANGLNAAAFNGGAWIFLSNSSKEIFTL